MRIAPPNAGRLAAAATARLPTGLSLRAISLVEGVRAGLAAALPVAAAEYFAAPTLTLAALGALLTCIADPAGPMRRRLPILFGFIVGGAALLAVMGPLRQAGIAVTVAAAAPLLLALAFLRVWGQPMQALGNLLSVVLLLGTDVPMDMAPALHRSAIFALGGLWSLLLTLAIWRIHPYGPARRAVADAWDTLAAYARALQSLAADADPEHWAAETRARRGAVRTAIEAARETLMDTLAARGATSGPAAQNLLRLDAADSVFAAMIGLAEAIEEQAPADRTAALPLLRRLRPLLTVLCRATEREHLHRQARFERTLAALTADAATADPALAPYATLLAERLRLAAKFIDPAQYLPGSGAQGEAGVPLRERIRGPLLANLSWRSASLRHAVRIAVVVGAALAVTLVWHGNTSHWLTITMVLVMQPFFALTWERALARVGGTLVGGLFAGALSFIVSSRVHVAGMLPPLAALALAVRQVSYGVYIAVYTPVVLLLVESFEPGVPHHRIALSRAGITILGGLLALLANVLLWPSWQPDQVRRDLSAALAAHAAYARAVLGGTADAALEAARRAAGLSSNNLEASIARALQEPRAPRARLQAALVADAALRRIAGRLIALSLSPAPCANCAWAVRALDALATGAPLPPRPPVTGDEQMDRLTRQVAVLPEIVARAGAYPEFATVALAPASG